MKLWIDDLRPAPDITWTHAKTSEEAIHLLKLCYAQMVGVVSGYELGALDAISFDHDLGGDDTTRPVMEYLIMNDFWPGHLYVHSANRVGRDHLLTLAHVYGPDDMEMPQRWMVAGR